MSGVDSTPRNDTVDTSFTGDQIPTYPLPGWPTVTFSYFELFEGMASAAVQRELERSSPCTLFTFHDLEIRYVFC